MSFANIKFKFGLVVNEHCLTSVFYKEVNTPLKAIYSVSQRHSMLDVCMIRASKHTAKFHVLCSA